MSCAVPNNKYKNNNKSIVFSSYINDTHNPDNFTVSQSSLSVPKKGCNSIRLVYENFNGLCPWQPNNDKLTLVKSILKQVSADCYLGVESRANWLMLPPKSQLRHIFAGDTPVNTVTAQNSFEQCIRAQEGGTAIVSFDKLALGITSSYSDPLGRWCSISIQGTHGRTTHIMVAYHAPKTPGSHLKATYTQQKRYFRSKGDFRFPRKMF